MAIESKLLAGLKLCSLALAMVERTYNWYVVLNHHLDAELVWLTQMKLDTKALLVLLTEEVIIMFTIVHNVQKRGLEFSVTVDSLEYMVQCIWLTLEIHGVMEEMIKHGLGANAAINAAFVRFLTKQVAVNTGSSVAKPKVKPDKLTEELAKATTVANEAKVAAKESLVVANKDNEDIKKLYLKNKELKK